ncbi:MAG: hypothetical protein ACRCY8_06045 [Dermatophilaceae bacterium]
MTPTSPADLLARHAPQHTGTDDLDGLLARVRRHQPTQRTARGVRRLVIATGAVAATVTAATLLPAVLKSGNGTAAALDQLANTAASRPAAVIPNGSYLHEVTVENPDGIPPGSSSTESGVFPRTLESWTEPTGVTWRYDRTAAGREEWFRFAPESLAGAGPGTAPQELMALPADEQALLDHLRPVVDGSSSTDEAIFVYLGDALRAGHAPPETQRAMIAAMARLPHIETERTRSATGTPCLSVTYAEPRRDFEQYVCFDEGTATLVEQGTVKRGELASISVVTERQLVTSVPADVRTKAAATPVAEG